MTPRFNGPLLWSLAAIAVVLFAVALSLPGVVRAAFLPGADAKSALFEEAVAFQDAYDEAEITYIDRFNGRSAFFEPKQPRRPAPRTTTPKRTTPKAPPTPREPTKKTRPAYSGPKLSALHGDHAFFTNGTLLQIGEEKEGLKLIAVEAPWIARVEHNGWEYEESLFQRSDEQDFFARKLTGEEEPGEPTTPAATVERGADGSTARSDDADRDAEGRERADEGRGEAVKLDGLDVPAPLTDEEIAAMTKEEAQSHLAKLAPARSALRRMDGDDAKAVRERVESEWKALMAKMRESS